MAFICGGQEPRIETTKSEKRPGRGRVLTEHAFYTLFSLCMHTDVACTWPLAKVQESGENVTHTCLIFMAHPVVCGCRIFVVVDLLLCRSLLVTLDTGTWLSG